MSPDRDVTHESQKKPTFTLWHHRDEGKRFDQAARMQRFQPSIHPRNFYQSNSPRSNVVFNCVERALSKTDKTCKKSQCSDGDKTLFQGFSRKISRQFKPRKSFQLKIHRMREPRVEKHLRRSNISLRSHARLTEDRQRPGSRFILYVLVVRVTPLLLFQIGRTMSALNRGADTLHGLITFVSLKILPWYGKSTNSSLMNRVIGEKTWTASRPPVIMANSGLGTDISTSQGWCS